LAKAPSEAINEAADDIKSSLERGIRTPLEKLASSLGVEGCNSTMKKIVAKEIKKVTDKIVKTIIEITTLDGFMEASKVIARTLDKIEESLKDEKTVEQASAALWHTITNCGMQLYTRIWALSEKVKSALSGQPDEAVDIITGFLDNVFEVQIRAFNSIRIQYIRNVQASLKDGKSAKEVSRTAFRTALFSTVDVLGHHHWVKAVDAFKRASIVIVQELFRENVWPPIKAGLESIQALIPDEIGKMGLKIEPLAWAIVAFLIKMAVQWLITKVFVAIERAVFTQESSGGGGYGSSE